MVDAPPVSIRPVRIIEGELGSTKILDGPTSISPIPASRVAGKVSFILGVF